MVKCRRSLRNAVAVGAIAVTQACAPPASGPAVGAGLASGASPAGPVRPGASDNRVSPAVPLPALRIAAFEAGPHPGLSAIAPEIVGIAREALSEVGGLGGEGPPTELEVTVVALGESVAQGSFLVSASARLSGGAGPSDERSVSVRRILDFEPDAAEEAVRDRLRRGLGDLFSTAAISFGVRLASDDDLSRWLVLGPATEPTREAVLEVQRRALRDALPAVRSLLPCSDPDLLLAIAGTLAELGDRGDGTALVDAMPLGDAETLIAAMPALARIGGPAVRSFLDALAGGHSSISVRQAAALWSGRLRDPPAKKRTNRSRAGVFGS